MTKICLDFYREDEIMSAKALLDQIVPKRLPKRQCTNKCRATIIDVIKVCTERNITLPVYYAADLSRLPPVDASHCNVAAELQQLRAEVRSFQQVSDQLAVLRQEVLELRQKQEVSVPCNATEFPPASTSGGLSGQCCNSQWPFSSVEKVH